LERADAIRYIRSLTNSQAVEFFYEAFAGRPLEKTYPDEPIVEEYWTLAEVYLFEKDADREDLSNIIEPQFIALPDQDAFPEGLPDWTATAPICQQGGCDRCGSLYKSWVKRVVCPNCGASGAAS